MGQKLRVAPITIEELHLTQCAFVPCRPGVYFVHVPPSFQVRFGDTFPVDHPHYGSLSCRPVKNLQKKFLSGNQNTLYIGKSDDLRSRIKQLTDLAYGKGKEHRGGRVLWQIHDSKKLIVSWQEHVEPQTRKNQLLDEYYNEYGVLPLANWQRPRIDLQL